MWPSLVKQPGFLEEFVTPIIKATKGAQVISFFTLPEYHAWSRTVDIKKWNVKYFKGLGTSTNKEAKEYFSDLDKHRIEFEWIDNQDGDAIEKAFDKKRVSDRKAWLNTVNPETFVDHSVKHLRYKDFVDKELVLFSVADCARSIPSICDGLKPG